MIFADTRMRLGVLFLATANAGCALLDWDALENGGGGGAIGAARDGGGASTTSSAGAGGSDGGAQTARCDPKKPFSPPVSLPGPINMPNTNEEDGRLTADERTLYFARDEGDGEKFDIYVAERASLADPFGPPAPVAELNSPARDDGPFPLTDGLTIYFSSDRPPSGSSQIYVAKRERAGGAFGAPQIVGALEAAAPSLEEPFFLPDDTTIYFDDGYDERLMTARASMGSFTAAVGVPGISTAISAGSPVVTGDQLTLFFVENSSGTDMIMKASRSSPADPFGTPEPVSELDGISPDGSRPTWVSADGCHIVVQSVLSGSWNLYFAARGL